MQVLHHFFFPAYFLFRNDEEVVSELFSKVGNHEDIEILWVVDVGVRYFAPLETMVCPRGRGGRRQMGEEGEKGEGGRGGRRGRRGRRVEGGVRRERREERLKLLRSVLLRGTGIRSGP
jgi:hypothetical protein